MGQALGFKPGRHAPHILAPLDVAALEAVLRRWSQAHTTGARGALSIDGKYLRGRRRNGQGALQVGRACAQEVGQFIAAGVFG